MAKLLLYSNCLLCNNVCVCVCGKTISSKNWLITISTSIQDGRPDLSMRIIGAQTAIVVVRSSQKTNRVKKSTGRRRDEPSNAHNKHYCMESSTLLQ